MKENKISVTLWMDPSIVQRLDLYASYTGITRSQAVRELVDERLAHYEELFAWMEQRADEARERNYFEDWSKIEEKYGD